MPAAASVIAGSVVALRNVTGPLEMPSKPVAGNHFNDSANRVTSTIPSQKLGIATPSELSPVSTRSASLPRRIAAIDAERDADQQREQRRVEDDLDGDRQPPGEHAPHLLAGVQRRAEVAVQRVPRPPPVLVEQAVLQAELVPDLGELLGGGVVPGDRGGRIAGDELDQHERDERRQHDRDEEARQPEQAPATTPGPAPGGGSCCRTGRDGGRRLDRQSDSHRYSTFGLPRRLAV